MNWTGPAFGSTWTHVAANITNIGRSGASMKTHQELARHSEPSLTMRYTHPHVEDRIAAVAGLPKLSAPRTELREARATGTEG